MDIVVWLRSLGLLSLAKDRGSILRAFWPRQPRTIGGNLVDGCGGRREGTAALVKVRHPGTGTRSIQNFLKHSPKWNVVTVLHSTTLLLPSGCSSML